MMLVIAEHESRIPLRTGEDGSIGLWHDLSIVCWIVVYFRNLLSQKATLCLDSSLCVVRL